MVDCTRCQITFKHIWYDKTKKQKIKYLLLLAFFAFRFKLLTIFFKNLYKVLSYHLGIPAFDMMTLNEMHQLTIFK